MTKENKKSKTDNKQKCYDIRGNEINDPYNVIVLKMEKDTQELERNPSSLENPEKLLETYTIGIEHATLIGTFSEIYKPSLKKMNSLDLDEIEGANEVLRNHLVKRLLQNQRISNREMLDILTRNKNESAKRLAEAFSNFNKGPKLLF